MRPLKSTSSIILFTILLLALTACKELLPPAPEENQILDGPLEGLTPDQKARFIAGDIAFNDEVFTPATGLGPYFVATSCGTCHAGDGKGHPFTTLTRFGQSDPNGNQYLSMGGPQLQNRAIYNYQPEQIPAGASFSKFTPPANTGLGFLEALSDAQLLALADPNDTNGDGISGVPNWIDPPAYFSPTHLHQPQSGRYIGRFGKKAAAIDLLQQTVNAYNQDMGITSEYAPLEPSINGGANPDDVPDPEVPSSTVHNVVFYLRTLKAPLPRNPDDADTRIGKQVFIDIKCGACHTPQWTTPDNDIAALSRKTFYPYTDLLMHDMGPGLDDGYTEGTATTSEWRTPALWGLGLSKLSQGGQYYLLHDGRATTIHDAIILHGGEAQSSKDRYLALPETDKQKLIKFLESL